MNNLLINELIEFLLDESGEFQDFYYNLEEEKSKIFKSRMLDVLANSVYKQVCRGRYENV